MARLSASRARTSTSNPSGYVRTIVLPVWSAPVVVAMSSARPDPVGQADRRQAFGAADHRWCAPGHREEGGRLPLVGPVHVDVHLCLVDRGAAVDEELERARRPVEPDAARRADHLDAASV